MIGTLPPSGLVPVQPLAYCAMRASNNIVLNSALSDGFNGGTSLWLSPLLAQNPNLPANTQSWSLNLTARADLASANFRDVRPSSSFASDAGLLQLGRNMGQAIVPDVNGGQTSAIMAFNYQVIRTGSGNINVNAGRSVQLLNPFAAIYTAGTQVANPTTVVTANDFVLPVLTSNLSNGTLGPAQQAYPAQYRMAGGNVSISAGHNIERLTRNSTWSNR